MKDIFLVDADDTILDFHGVATKAVRMAFTRCNLVWKENYQQEYKIFNDALWQALERKELTRDELMNKRFHYFLAHLKIDHVDGDYFNQCYLDYLSNNPLFFVGAEEFLFRLKEIGRVFIVTNGTEWIQKSRFDILDLWAKADGVFISQQIGYDKPAKEYTDYVIRHIQDFERSRAVWIGDSLSADIKAANDAGIDSIWFNPTQKTPSTIAQPDFTAKNFQEILTIVQEKMK